MAPKAEDDLIPVITVLQPWTPSTPRDASTAVISYNDLIPGITVFLLLTLSIPRDASTTVLSYNEYPLMPQDCHGTHQRDFRKCFFSSSSLQGYNCNKITIL